MEFDRISDKEEFDNGKDAEEQSTDSLFDNSNLKESSSNSQKDIKKMYSKVEKQEIIAEFYKLKKEFKSRAKGMSYDMNKIDKKIAQSFGVSRSTINNWKKKFGFSKNKKKYTNAEKWELLKNFYKIKKENPQLRKDKIAQMLNIHISTLYSWERKSKGSKAGIKKIYSEIEKQEIIAAFDELKKEFKTRAKGMLYNVKKLEEKIAKKLGVALRTIYYWKKQFEIPKNKRNALTLNKVEIA
uniref:Transposase n=1 Tax=Globodera rostochiensis TaxID=31243 RepID=A0A914IDL0_GLORO